MENKQNSFYIDLPEGVIFLQKPLFINGKNYTEINLRTRKLHLYLLKLDQFYREQKTKFLSELQKADANFLQTLKNWKPKKTKKLKFSLFARETKKSLEYWQSFRSAISFSIGICLFLALVFLLFNFSRNYFIKHPLKVSVKTVQLPKAQLGRVDKTKLAFLQETPMVLAKNIGKALLSLRSKFSLPNLKIALPKAKPGNIKPTLSRVQPTKVLTKVKEEIKLVISTKKSNLQAVNQVKTVAKKMQVILKNSIIDMDYSQNFLYYQPRYQKQAVSLATNLHRAFTLVEADGLPQNANLLLILVD